MAVEFVEVTEKYPKEFYEILDACFEIVKNSKEALADGFSLGEDVTAIIGGSMGKLMTAIDGTQKVGEEFKQELAGCIKAGGAFGANVAELFMTKEEEVTPE